MGFYNPIRYIVVYKCKGDRYQIFQDKFLTDWEINRILKREEPK